MIRRNRGRNTKVEAKQDVVKSRAISSKKAATVILSVATAALLLVVGVPEATGNNAESEEAQRELIHHNYKMANVYRESAHYWRHKRGADHKYHSLLTPITNSLKVEKKRHLIWKFRAKSERKAYTMWLRQYKAKLRKYESANTDLHAALRLAARHHGVSYTWLHSCAHSEGHIDGRRSPGGPIDPFIMNHQGSGAGGWMQFMESTFYGNLEGASTLPSKYKRWNSKLGQAYVAAYMFSIGQSRQWTGAGC